MTVNIEMLQKAMNEKKVTIDKLAGELHVDKSTIYRKLKTNGESFTVGEMHKIVEVLGLSPTAASHIFLFSNSQ